MTTTQSLSGARLTADADDDQMQIGTSPYMHNDDFDIDLDDTHTHTHTHYVEDNSMLDDPTETLDSMQQDPSETYQDDIMHEETADEDILDLEEDFLTTEQEGGGAAVDGRLTVHQAQDELFENIPWDPPPRADRERPPQGSETEYGEVHGELHEEGPEEVPEEELVDDEEEDTNTESNPHDTDARPTDEHAEPTTTDDLETVPAPTDAVNTIDFAEDTSTAEEDEEPEEHQDAPKNEHDSNRDQPALAVDDTEATNEIASLVDEIDQKSPPADGIDNEERASPFQHLASTHLHPVIVDYQGTRYPLFPASDSPDDAAPCFLDDPTLAFETFDKLFAACRELLDTDLGDDDEMVMAFESLGLTIFEDSKYASELTLAQVIDTYMLLCQNEQLSIIEPLACSLWHRVCTKTQLAYLADAARTGKTYSTIVLEHHGSPAADEAVSEAIDETTAYYNTADVLDERDYADDQEPTYAPDDMNPGGDVEKPDNLVGNVNHHETARTEAVLHPPTLAEQPLAAGLDSQQRTESSEVRPEADSQPAQSLYVGQSPHSVEDDAESTGEHQYATESEEDIFSQDHQGTATTETENIENGNPEELAGQVEDGELDFDEWDDEEDREHNTEATLVPVTPSKAVHGKRKLPEDDDFLSLELTPEPKRNRAS